MIFIIMKLTDLLEDIINEAISGNDLKNYYSSIKKGVTDIGNKSIPVGKTGNKPGKFGAKAAISKTLELGRDVGFDIPTASKGVISSKVILGPFNSTSSIPNFNYLKVHNDDMIKLKSLKNYFGSDFEQNKNIYGSIQFKNFNKYKKSGEYIFVYNKNQNGIIIYYSKLNFGTYFYLENTLGNIPNTAQSVDNNDINLLDEVKSKLKLNDNINTSNFKKIKINNPEYT